jgi:hypothetical protein
MAADCHPPLHLRRRVAAFARKPQKFRLWWFGGDFRAPYGKEYTRIHISQCGCIHYDHAAGCVEKKVSGAKIPGPF